MPEHSFVEIETADGGVDVYLKDDDMMVNHVADSATWDPLVQAAARADWTVLMLDGPPCITREEQRLELPAELREEAVLVSCGADLLEAVGVA